MCTLNLHTSTLEMFLVQSTDLWRVHLLSLSVLVMKILSYTGPNKDLEGRDWLVLSMQTLSY